MRIAITVITYNRHLSLKRVITSLKNAYYDNRKVDLIISADKGDNPALYEYIDGLSWEYGELIKEIKPERMGLRNHILSCGDYFEKYNQDALIILEDDLYVTKDYLSYAFETVEKYKECSDIGGISLYAMSRNLEKDIPFIPLKSRYDVYFMQYAQSWGQIWMKEQWRCFKNWYDNNKDYNFNNPKIPSNVRKWPKTSWLKYHIAYCIENNKYFVYPYNSLSTNFADAGEHYTSKTNKMQVDLLYGRKNSYYLPDFGDEDALKYDAFEENEKIYDALGLTEAELCIDLYGVKQNEEKKRYLLTREKLNYKVIKSFDLAMTPHDRNVLENIEGDMIFLYDTEKAEEHKGYKKKIYNKTAWNYYYKAPNVFKYNVPYIYSSQVLVRIRFMIKNKLKRRRK